MNEDQNNDAPAEAPAAPEVPDTSTDNIPADQGGETTSPEEVAELLNLPPQQTSTNDDEDEDPDDSDKGDDDPDAPETPPEPKDTPPAPKEEEKKPEEKPETPPEEKVFALEVEDVNGEKFTLKPGDDLEEALKEFEPKNNGQIFKIIDDLQQLRADEKQYKEDQETQAAETAKNEKIAEIQSGWEKEIEALQGSKRVPTTVDGQDNERVNQVFQYMNEENEKRMDDGRPLLNSFEDALDKLELKETKETQAKKDKEEKELAKKKGSLVGGSSAPASSGTPVYKGGARNANEALRQQGLI